MAPISIDFLPDTNAQRPPTGAIDLEEVRDFLVRIAVEAGEVMRNAVPAVATSKAKSNSSDRVTATDHEIERLMRDALTARYPSFAFLGEETSRKGQRMGDGPVVVCDPIDGTLNFIHGFPNVAVSLGLALDRKPVVGVVYNPFRQDLFWAVAGKGAFLTQAGGECTRLPLRPAEPLHGLSSCLVALEWGSERQGPNWHLRMRTAANLLSARSEGGQMVQSIRSSGSAALSCCHVAAGLLDLWWEGGCWAWDVCAAWAILEEAGGLMVSANPGAWCPSLEGRTYMAVRHAPSGQKELVQEMWECVDGRFEF